MKGQVPCMEERALLHGRGEFVVWEGKERGGGGGSLNGRGRSALYGRREVKPPEKHNKN